MNKLKSTTMWGFAYFGMVVIFSLLYKASFVINPDSFILNNQLNLTPIQDVYDHLWKNETSNSNKFPVPGLDKLQLDLSKVVSELDVIESDIKAIDEQRDILEKSMNDLYKRNSESMWSNAQDYEKEQKESGVYLLEQALEEEVKLLEKLASENTWNTSYGIIIANKRVELANVRVKTAKKDYEISSYILKNLGAFSDKDTVSSIEDMEASLKEITVLQSSYNKKVGDIRKTMHSYLEKWSKERSKVLGLVDFVYYSIGISTTTTFGDITANSRLIRGIVSFQLFISIFIMGGFVNSALSNKKC